MTNYRLVFPDVTISFKYAGEDLYCGQIVLNGREVDDVSIIEMSLLNSSGGEHEQGYEKFFEL